MEINLTKTMVTAYDFGTKSVPADLFLITFRGERLRTLSHDESYPYLGFNISLNGDWTDEFDKIHRKTREIETALVKHKYSSSQGEYLFSCSAIPLFRYSVAVVPWTVEQCWELTQLWARILKNAWHLSPGTARCIFLFPSTSGGKTVQ
eukprot:1402456-Rhodomonas_salina.1